MMIIILIEIGAVAMQFFRSKRWKNDWSNEQQTIFEKKTICEKRKLSMNTLREEFKPNALENFEF